MAIKQRASTPKTPPSFVPEPGPSGKGTAPTGPRLFAQGAPQSGGNNIQAQLDQLEALRQQAESGAISVTDYIRQGSELSHTLSQQMNQIARSGESGAKQIESLLPRFQATGFRYQPGESTGAVGSLPLALQDKYIQETIPADTPDRDRLIASLPKDINPFSDAGRIELERIRQQGQMSAENKTASEARASRLSQLSDLLTKQGDAAYSENAPAILESLQGRGLLHSSAVGSELAKERTRQQRLTDALIAGQSLSDRDTDINATLGVGATGRDFESAALSRDFSNQDLAKSFEQSLTLANLTKPKGGGKGGGGAVSGAATGAEIGGAFGNPYAALTAALIGGGAGYYATRT